MILLPWNSLKNNEVLNDKMLRNSFPQCCIWVWDRNNNNKFWGKKRMTKEAYRMPRNMEEGHQNPGNPKESYGILWNIKERTLRKKEGSRRKEDTFMEASRKNMECGRMS